MSKLRTALEKVHHHGAWCLALSVGLWASWWISVEWVYPACSLGEGAVGVHGFPLPHLMWAASSLEYHVLPHVLLLNIALLTGSVRLALVPLWRVVGSALRAGLTWLGVAASTLGLSWYLLLGSLGALRPLAVLSGRGGPTSYWELRPARFDAMRGYSCQPSAHWYRDR